MGDLVGYQQGSRKALINAWIGFSLILFFTGSAESNSFIQQTNVKGLDSTEGSFTTAELPDISNFISKNGLKVLLEKEVPRIFHASSAVKTMSVYTRRQQTRQWTNALKDHVNLADPLGQSQAMQTSGVLVTIPSLRLQGLPNCGSSLTLSMNIRGQGSEKSVVDCSGTGLRVMEISGPNVTVRLSGITLFGGSVPSGWSPPEIPMMNKFSPDSSVIASEPLNQPNSSPRKAYQQRRRGASSSAPELFRMSMKAKESDDMGGCILCSGAALLIEKDVVISNCTGKYGGGVAVVPLATGEGEVRMTEATLQNNVARQGGAVFVQNGMMQCDHSIFHSNKVLSSTPIFGDLSLGNPEAPIGGAVFAWESHVSLKQHRSHGNVANARCSSDAQAGSMCGVAGGDIAIANGLLQMVDSVVDSSKATSAGNASHASGGAIYAEQQVPAISISNSQFTGCQSATMCTPGGLESGSNCVSHGGAIYLMDLGSLTQTGSFVVFNTTFDRNTAQTKCLKGAASGCSAHGGAISAYYFTGELKIWEGNFDRNVAELSCDVAYGYCWTYGGTMALTAAVGNVNISSTQMKNSLSSVFCDDAGKDGGCTALGGVISIVESSAALQALSSTFMGNQVEAKCGNGNSGKGCNAQGGLIAQVESTMDVYTRNCNFFNNIASAQCGQAEFSTCFSGAGVYFTAASQGQVTFLSAHMHGNSAINRCQDSGTGGGCKTNGGVISFESMKASSLTIGDSWLYNNSARAECQVSNTGGCYALGGVVSLESPEEPCQFKFSETTFSSNGVETFCGAMNAACMTTAGVMYGNSYSDSLNSSIAVERVVISDSYSVCTTKKASFGGAGAYASAIYAYGCEFIMQESTITNSQVSLLTQSTPCGGHFSCSSIAQAGALFLHTRAAVISNSAFLKNSVSCLTTMGGICSAQGGAVFSSLTHLMVDNTQFDSNTVLSNSTSDQSAIAGGGLGLQFSEVECHNCSITQNGAFAKGSTVSIGGGLHCVGGPKILRQHGFNSNTTQWMTSRILLSKSVVINNTASSVHQGGIGGALRASQLCDIELQSSTTLYGNSVIGPEAASGAAIAVTGNLTTSQNVLIMGHQLPPGGQGSGIHASQQASVNADNTLLTNNTGSALYTIGNVSMALTASVLVRSAQLSAASFENGSYIFGFFGSSQRDQQIESSFQCNSGYVVAQQHTMGVSEAVFAEVLCYTEDCKNGYPDFSYYSVKSSSMIVQCRPCEAGTYSLNTRATDQSVCRNCPFGAECLGGADVRSRQGYWWFPSSRAMAKQGVLPSRLLQLPPGYNCMQYDRSRSPHSKHTSAECSSLDNCAPGRTGVLCGSCLPGYGIRMYATWCGPDSDCYHDMKWFIPLLVISMIFGSFALVLYASTLILKDGNLTAKGTFSIFVGYIQSTHLIIHSSAAMYTDVDSFFSRSKTAVLAIFQLGATSSPAVNNAGICILPSMTEKGRLAASALIITSFSVWVCIWLFCWRHVYRFRWLHILRSKWKTFQSKQSAESSSCVSFGPLSIQHKGFEVQMQCTVALMICIEFVYQPLLSVCIRSLSTVQVPGEGLRWLFDASVKPGVWQLGPGLSAVILLLLPLMKAAFVEITLKKSLVSEMHSHRRSSFDSSSHKNSNVGMGSLNETPSWYLPAWKRAVCTHHVGAFNYLRRHWGVVMIYKRALLVLLAYLVSDPASRAILMIAATFSFVSMQWVAAPFQQKSVQTVEVQLTSLLVIQAVLQLPSAVLLTAAAPQPTTPFFLVVSISSALLVAIPFLWWACSRVRRTCIRKCHERNQSKGSRGMLEPLLSTQ